MSSTDTLIPVETTPTEPAHSQLVMVFDSTCPLRQRSVRVRLDKFHAVTFGRSGVRAFVPEGKGKDRRLRVDLPDGKVSTLHARLRRKGDHWTLEDHSKNGTIVDGERVRAPMALMDGAVLEIGSSFFVYRATALDDERESVGDEELVAPCTELATFNGPLARQFDTLAKLADTNVPVVVLGETGTGKEIVARAIHKLSRRRGEFVAVNCGSLPAELVESMLFGHKKGAFSGADSEQPGFVRAANGGTLFLDEIGDLPAASQAALLRVLQEGEVTPVGSARPVKVDVRVVSATWRDIRAMVDAGSFREDLWSRLADHVVRLPPLRERREDTGLLLRAVVAGAGRDRFSLEPPVGPALMRHRWPANVRELARALNKAAILAVGRPVRFADLTEELQEVARRISAPDSAPAPAPLAIAPLGSGPVHAKPAFDSSPESVDQLLRAHHGNVEGAARAIARRPFQIRRWIRQHGIDIERIRSGN